MENDENIINNPENLLETNKKIIGNAIVSYFFGFLSILFLFNKTNNYINNDFVKSHTKNAIFLHCLFLFTYIIFISNSLFSSISLLGLGLNIVITNIIFIGLLILLIIGIYKSNKGLKYKVYKGDIFHISKQKNILDITGDGKITEKEKITIILSFIPFIGFINFAKYKDNKTIQNGTRLNILISLIITLLYIYGNTNIVNIFSLIYIIIIAFIGINIFTRDELIQIKLPEIFSPRNFFINLVSYKEYFNNYSKNKDLISFSNIITQKIDKVKKQDILFEKFLNDQKNIKLPKILIYIPLINLIFIFFKDTRYKFHIINGVYISIILVILLILGKYEYINKDYYLLLIFPILFGIGYINNNILAYRIPIIFDIYIFLFKGSLFLKGKKKVLNKKRNVVNDIHLKVEGKEVIKDYDNLEIKKEDNIITSERINKDTII